MTEAKVRRLSYSRLSTYDECPEMYRWKYVERVPEQPSWWSVGGTAFHSVAERYLRGELTDDPTDGMLRAAWLWAWNEAYAEVNNKLDLIDQDPKKWRAANRGQEDRNWWISEGYQMCRRFVDWWQARAQGLTVLEVDGQLGLELRLEVDLGGVPVVAIPDALVVDEHGQLNIVDYKTGKPPKSSFQLGVYKAAVKAATGLDVTWGLYYMARPGELLVRDLGKHDPDAIGNRFAWLAEQLAEENYAPTPGDACKFCPYKRDRCTYYNGESA